MNYLRSFFGSKEKSPSRSSIRTASRSQSRSIRQSIAKVNMEKEIDGLNKIKTRLIDLEKTAQTTLDLIRLQDKKYNRTARLGRFLLRNTGFGTDRAKFKKMLEQRNYPEDINNFMDKFHEQIRQINGLIKNAGTPAISADAYKHLLVRRLDKLEKNVLC